MLAMCLLPILAFATFLMCWLKLGFRFGLLTFYINSEHLFGDKVQKPILIFLRWDG